MHIQLLSRGVGLDQLSVDPDVELSIATNELGALTRFLGDARSVVVIGGVVSHKSAVSTWSID